MAKAKFHKSQRVFVKPVGTWAHIEQVIPKWVRGCSEPIKILYDCGMGREFSQDELEEESKAMVDASDFAALGAKWRVERSQNRWVTAEKCGHHPYPGTHPVIVTSDRDWGGWRVPGSEYDLDPMRIEQQARIIARAPAFMAMTAQFVDHAHAEPENLGDSMIELSESARRLLSDLAR